RIDCLATPEDGEGNHRDIREAESEKLSDRGGFPFRTNDKAGYALGPIDYRIDIYHCGLLFLHLAHGSELRFTPEEVKSGAPRELARKLPAPFSFALERLCEDTYRIAPPAQWNFGG